MSFKQITSKLFLISVMAAIGVFTVFAAANTYEVVSKKDVVFSSVITKIEITNSQSYNRELINSSSKKFDNGNFGIPKKVKFPETKQHIDIISATHSSEGWLASRGLGQTFITAQPRQKVFGEAVVYLKYNTPTTQHIGDVLTGDLINVVTTEGWQFGYQVVEMKEDISLIDRTTDSGTSHVLFILIDQESNVNKNIYAKLVKVGERI